MNRVAVLLALSVLGCGSGMHGTYSDRMGAMQYRFRSGGHVTVAVLGIRTELEYVVEGKKVKIISPQGSQVLDVLEDGTLEGPLGMRFSKQE
ncbi:MAG TPA: hypothetical protein VFU23_01950 [Gemmatimonadales bacterium]|nr:hypothetical protein [Gemmatimonadales bacterium]